MEMTNPNTMFYSVVIVPFFLLYFGVFMIKAQNIVPFPTGTSLDSPLTGNIVNEQKYFLGMTGATTTVDNQTICTGFTLPATPSEFWIIQFEGKASVDVVHHMTLYGCATVPTTNPCGCGMENRSPLYSWVRNTPKVRYTGSGQYSAGGFRIGGSSDKQYLFLEIHYCHQGTTNDRSGIMIHTTLNNTNNQGFFFHDLAIFPIMGKGTIPGDTSSFNIDTCTTSLPAIFDGKLTFLGFQVHTHNLGRLVSAYYIADEGTEYEIGVGNPLWPEAYVRSKYSFSPVSSKGKSIYTRCVYSSTGTTSATNTNGVLPKTMWQEMCIFNLLVYHKDDRLITPFSTKNAFLKGNCTSSQVTVIDNQPSSTTLLTAIPDLDVAAAYGNISSGTYGYSSVYQINMEGENFENIFF